MSIFLGPLSDSVGRKIIFLIPMFGLLVKSLIITFIVHFKLNIYYIYLIRSTGFFYALVMFDIISVLEIVIIFFLLPETVTNKQWRDKSVLGSIKNVFGFYFTEGSLHDKLCYLIALGTFFFGVVTTLGRTTLETIYQLGEPFCWDSVKIGYYGAFRLTALVLFRALFASISVVETLCTSASNTLYNAVYNATVEYYKGILDTNYFYLANLIDGLSGSYFAMLVAIFAYTADITVPGKSRTIAMAVMEGCLPVAASIGLLSTGFLIKSTGFFYPMVLFVTLGALDLVVVFFLLPETRVTKTLDSSPLKSLKTVQKRIFYAIAMGILFFSVVTALGRSALETIYQLGSPFCWDSIKIGYFGALPTTSMVIFSVTVIKILHRCLQEEVIGIISCLSAMAGFLLEGMADTSLLMYLAAFTN
ncbi:solute carrier family 46 member 3 [Patella vulgata]|uniref:solute carrier family 46 member 3 n=1 Tax=Patella vulgata TaxID=6465 RepID=UPI0024A97E1B|nr:solute carrier family 46 member 3 [Patella vulgata]